MSEDKSAAAEAMAAESAAVLGKPAEPKKSKAEGKTRAITANAPVEGGATTVKVYCKGPHGLRIKDPKGGVHVINGSHHPQAIAGFGVTALDAEVADFLFASQAKHPMVVNGLVFRAGTAETGNDMAAERSAEITGFEPRSQEGKIED
jgi:hypothetical protein